MKLNNHPNLTPRLESVLDIARKEAGCYRHEVIHPFNLLVALLKLGSGIHIDPMLQSGLDLAVLRQTVNSHLGQGTYDGEAVLSPSCDSVFVKASSIASEYGHSYIGTEHLVIALITSDSDVQHLLTTHCRVDHSEIVRGVIEALEASCGQNTVLATPEELLVRHQERRRSVVNLCKILDVDPGMLSGERRTRMIEFQKQAMDDISQALA